MTPAQIFNKRLSIQLKISTWQAKLKELQEQCEHAKASHVNKANTGNYDPSADEYWTEHTCPCCGKRWTTDQNWDRK